MTTNPDAASQPDPAQRAALIEELQRMHRAEAAAEAADDEALAVELRLLFHQRATAHPGSG